MTPIKTSWRPIDIIINEIVEGQPLTNWKLNKRLPIITNIIYSTTMTSTNKPKKKGSFSAKSEKENNPSDASLSDFLKV